jgi:hypothetical protein
MPANFILSKNACFRNKIINIKKGHVEKKFRPRFLESAYFFDSKTSKLLVWTFFCSGRLNSQRVEKREKERPKPDKARTAGKVSGHGGQAHGQADYDIQQVATIASAKAPEFTIDEYTHTNAYRNVSTRNLIARTHSNVGKIVGNLKRAKTGVK